MNIEISIDQNQASKRCQTGANKHVKYTKGKTNMLSNKNVGLDRVSIVP